MFFEKSWVVLGYFLRFFGASVLTQRKKVFLDTDLRGFIFDRITQIGKIGIRQKELTIFDLLFSIGLEEEDI